MKFILNTNRSISILYIQNTNRSVSILYEFHTEYLFEGNLYWVYSNVHVTQIAFLLHEFLMNFISSNTREKIKLDDSLSII